MTQANEPDLGPLTWVKSEIDQALTRATDSLKAAGETADGPAKAQFAQTHVHQVHGALSIIGLDGVTKFVAALDLYLGGLARSEVPLDEPHLKLGLRALASISNYLDELVHGAPNQPLRLLPLYRELVVARGEEAPPAADLFFPDLGVRISQRADAQEFDPANRLRQRRSMRQRFQRGLLDWLRNPAPQSEDAMRTALAGLEASEDSPAMRALWWAGQAFIDTLSATASTDLQNIKYLLSRLEAQLRHTSEDGPQVLPERLLRELLYHIASQPAVTPLQRAAHKAWELDALIPEPGSVVSDLPRGPLLEDLHSRLTNIKEEWNTFGEQGPTALAEFAAQLEAFAQSATALGNPVLNRLFSGMCRFALWLSSNPQRYSEPIALEFATALLLAETTLDRSLLDSGFQTQVGDALSRLEALARGEEVSANPSAEGVESARKQQEKEALAQLSHEILSSLATIEQTLDDFFRDHSKRAPLENLTAPLHQIEGALTMLGETEAITLVKEAGQTIEHLTQEETPVEDAELTELARRFSALGFFIQSLQYSRTPITEYLHPEASATQARAAEFEPPMLEFEVPTAHTPSVLRTPIPLDGVETYPTFQIDVKGEAPTVSRTPRPQHSTPAIPIPPASAQTQHLVEAPKEELDAELLSIFIEEAHEVLENVSGHLQMLRDAPGNRDYLTTIRRGFHTLKGSGRMVGLTDLGEAAWGMEQTLNRWLQLEWTVTPALLNLLEHAHREFSAWVDQIETEGVYQRDAASLLAEAERLRSTETPIEEPGAVQPSTGAKPPEARPRAETKVEPTPEAEPVAPSEEHQDLVETSLDIPDIFLEEIEEEDIPAQPEAFPTLEAQPVPETPAAQPVPEAPPAPEAQPAPEAPPALEAQPVAEDEPELDEINFIEVGELEPDAAFTDDREATTTAAPAVEPEATAATEPPTPEVPPEAMAHRRKSDADKPAAFAAASDEPELPAIPKFEPFKFEPFKFEPFNFDLTATEIDLLAATKLTEPPLQPPETAEETPAEFSKPEADTLLIGDVEISRALFELYVAEAQMHITTLHQEFDHLTDNPTLHLPEPALRAAHSCAGISGTARCTPLYLLGRALEHAQQRLYDQKRPPAANDLDLFKAAADTLDAMLTEVISQKMPLETPELIEQLDQIGHAPLESAAKAPDEQAITDAIVKVFPEANAPQPAPQSAPVRENAPPVVADEIDEQLLPIFLEEAEELVNGLHTTLRVWYSDTGSSEHPQLIKRQLHTLKGSARMAGAMALGNQIHQLESRLDSALTSGTDIRSLIEEIASALDITEQLIGVLTGGPAPVTAPSAPVAPAQTPAPTQTLAPAQTSAPTQSRTPRPAVAPAAPAPAAAAADNESVAASALRVRAELVDRFVNDASEIGVARTRIEGELRQLRRSMIDLTENVIRLRNQLREIEIQADVQMQTRIARAESKHAEFDPLEMDRYTRLQELTRMMAESVNDVTTVQQNLLKNIDSADFALHSQARITRELQQSLMQVRMVPFDSLAVRLYRIVRQGAKELGKRANLDMRGGGIEIDRGVLEHIVAPLEHLIRNSLAHGIEKPEIRRAKGKPEIGQITLTTRQEGNEIVIELADDGAGLNFDRIIQRARERGLLGPDEIADERRLTNLIFVPGFSTAETVSAVSGRGVGMDVVKAETAAVGGRIDISTTPGTGTLFSIYLPLTLAVTQALLVRAGGHHYAIPASMISQVMELKVDAMERLRTDGGTDWLGQHYAYRYLPNLLGDHTSQPEIGRYSWVLLLHSGSQTLALHVDGLRGHQEIIVKNAGPQLTRIAGMSGATVLGDGEIVLIINPVAMVSREIIYGQSADIPVPVPVKPAHEPTVMVVDDSLTVRKITSRMLEREGYHVITAKDGVDAIESLIDNVPDVILSDIEMPRMDGFDLVRNIRADARLKNVPIIMITSRLADKHRDYAMEIGANHYMGKPYQEEELLALIAGYTHA